MKGACATAALLVATSMVAVAGCKATLKDGVASCDVDNDCPTGFVCRAGPGEDTRYCFSKGSDVARGRDVGDGGGGRGGSGGRDAGANASGSGGRGGSDSRDSGNAGTGGAGGVTAGGAGGSEGSAGKDAGTSGTDGTDASGGSGGSSAGCEPGVFDQSLFDQACFQ
jgi:hypothetical protein